MAWVSAHFYSMALGMQTTAQVFLPEADQGIGITGSVWDGKEELPVLYLLHGASDNSTIWMRRTSVERYNAGRRLAVVMPEAFLSMYTDQKYGYNYFTYITEELPEIMNRFFRISLDPKKSFVGGLSMGSYGSLLAAFNKPDRYAKAAIMSGGYIITPGSAMHKFFKDAEDAEKMAEHMKEDPFFAGQVNNLRICFGTFEEWEKSKYNLSRVLKQRVAEGTKLPELMISIGKDDFLYENNQFMLEELDDNKVPYIYIENEGCHEWAVWDRQIQTVLDWIAPCAVEKVGQTR